ncbi:hypothetical protein BD408DRAFT_173650 [Parasitella parasitica]|nr:hypothetical protein BD408DRAFT_173650 [Parasitella parasitica]
MVWPLQSPLIITLIEIFPDLFIRIFSARMIEKSLNPRPCVLYGRCSLLLYNR